MFVHWDIKKKIIAKKQSLVGICPNCKEKGYLTLHIYERLFRLYWFLPVFPLKNKITALCGICLEETNYNQFSDNLKIEAFNLEKNTQTKWYHFTGLVLFLGFCLWVYSFWIFDDAQNLEFVKNPQIGDIYKFKTQQNDFSSFKVLSIEKDSLEIQYNTKIVSRRKYVLETYNSFSGKTTKISKKEIKKWLKNQKLYDIDRL